MFNKEIEFQQSFLLDCIFDKLDRKLDSKKDVHLDIAKECQQESQKLTDYILGVTNKSLVTGNYFTFKFFSKLDEAYLLLGKHGYNSHLCRSLYFFI